jgi:hypothetical protein
VKAWPTLPDRVRDVIMNMVRSSCSGSSR